MADDLSWRNQHALLQLHPYVDEVVAKEQLKLTTSQQSLAKQYPLSIDYLAYLSQHEQYKDACTFLAYNLHHRIAVWWGYMCVVDVLTEILQKPAPVKDLSDVAKPRPFELPPFVQEMQKQAAQESPIDPKIMDQLNAAQARLKDIEQQLRQIIPAPLFDFADQALAEQNAYFKKVHGMEPMELLNSLVDKAVQIQEQEKRTGMSANIDPNSQIFAETKAIEEKVEKIRQETVALVKSALPAIDTEQQNKDRLSCLDAVFAYIAAPDEVNAQRLLDLGNKIPDKNEGLLSLVAFWSYGDLMPQGKQVIPTPAGLMSNGLNCLLLSCALQQGGIFNFAQRFQRYYNFGYECLLGKSNWSPYVAAGTSLHEERTKQIMDTLGIGDPIGGPKDTVQADATNSDKEHAANTTDFTEAQGNAFAQVGAQGNAQGSSATSSSQQTKVGIQSELLSDLQRLHQQVSAMKGMGRTNTANPWDSPTGTTTTTTNVPPANARTAASAAQYRGSTNTAVTAEQQLYQEMQRMRSQLQAQEQQLAKDLAAQSASASDSDSSSATAPTPPNMRFRGQ